MTDNSPRLYGLHRLPAEVAQRLAGRFAIDWNEDDRDLSPERLVWLGTEYDGLVTSVTDRISAAVFEAPRRRVQIIANFGVGVNLIDLAAARRHQVIVTNTPDVLTDCTADLTIGLMLMALRRLGEGDKIPRKGGPGITKSDLLVINKIDLAPYVGASLEVMERDTLKMRGDKPFAFTNLKTGEGLTAILSFIDRQANFPQQ